MNYFNHICRSLGRIVVVQWERDGEFLSMIVKSALQGVHWILMIFALSPASDQRGRISMSAKFCLDYVPTANVLIQWVHIDVFAIEGSGRKTNLKF